MVAPKTADRTLLGAIVLLPPAHFAVRPHKPPLAEQDEQRPPQAGWAGVLVFKIVYCTVSGAEQEHLNDRYMMWIVPVQGG